MFMKTRISVLIICVLIAQASMAQFHIGVKGGVNIGKVQGQSFKDEFHYGYNAGAFMNIGLGLFSIQPEVLFNQYSTTLDSNYKDIYQNVINSQQSKVKLNYLTIPILLDFKLLGPIHI